MELMQAAVLGLVQGITEFLPISSSGHLIFIPRLFGWPDQGLAFDVVVHLGTLVAVVIYFRKRIVALLHALCTRRPFSDTTNRLAWFLGLSVLPAGIVGLLFKDTIEVALRSPLVIAVTLIGWGIILGVADWYAKRSDSLKLEQTGWRQLVVVSCAQALALVPGTSRSGITMTAGLFTGLTKQAAAEFSFLMSVPVIAIAGAVKLVELLQSGFQTLALGALSIGFVVSALSGLVAIGWLMRLVKRFGFMPFVWYRIVIGMLILFVFM